MPVDFLLCRFGHVAPLPVRCGKSRRVVASGASGRKWGRTWQRNRPERAIHTWTVTRMKKKAERIGIVGAATEEEATDRAMEEFRIRDVDRFRISVKRS